MTQNYKDITGEKFNRLKVIMREGSTNQGKATWLCLCDCGNIVIVPTGSLKTGNQKSCGCLKKQNAFKMGSKRATHKLTGSQLFAVWNSMKQRCLNKNSRAYKYYGGKGITVYKKWANDFMCFYEWAINNGWCDGKEIDRINNGGDYTPQNCHFVKRKYNCSNRNSSRRWVLFGKTYRTSKEAADDFDVHKSTIQNWCNGNKKDRTQPRKHCYSFKVYDT